MADVALWPFTRLVHVWSAPLAYLWRPYVVYRARRGSPAAATPAPGRRTRPLPAQRLSSTLTLSLDGHTMSTPTPQQLIGKTVGDVLVRQPKALPIDISVDQARACNTDDHVHLLLLTESGRLIGTLIRTDLPDHLDEDGLALPHSRMSGRTAAADMPAEEARELLVASGQRRLAVVDHDGTLIGVLCLKRRLTGFCSDADILARAAERAGRGHPSA